MNCFLIRNIIFYLLFITVFYSCKSGSNEVPDLKRDRELLGQYFSAATTGMISAGSSLTYILHEPLEVIPSEEALKEFITLQPKLNYRVSIHSGMVITVTPEELMLPDQTYEVNLNLKVLDKSRYSKGLGYQLKTKKQGLAIQQTGMQLKEASVWEVQYRLRLADVTDTEKLKSCFQMADHRWTLEKKSETEYHLSAMLKPGEAEQPMVYDGKPIGSPDRGTLETEGLHLASKGEFQPVFSHHNEESQEFYVYFSQKISGDKDLTGLILVNEKAVPVSIDANKLTIFLSETDASGAFQILLSQGLASSQGKFLKKDVSFRLSGSKEKPGVEFVSEGYYFPSKGEFQIPVKTRALHSLRLMVVEIPQENVLQYLAWQSMAYADFSTLRMFGKPVYDEEVPLAMGKPDADGWLVHGIDLSEKIRRKPGSMYYIAMDFGPEHTDLACAKELLSLDFQTRLPDASFFEIRDRYYYESYFPSFGYDWRESANPCRIAFYTDRPVIQRMFICSDISVIAKKAGNEYRFAIADLQDLKPKENVRIDLFSLQAQKLGSTSTDNLGFANITGLPADAVVARFSQGNHTTYMELHAGESNSLTEFSVEGNRSDEEMDWFVYTERGVWRPGDTITIYLMSNGRLANAPAGMPIALSLYNPDQLLVDKQIRYYDAGHQIYAFRIPTSAEGKTGMYRCEIAAGPNKISKRLRVETFKPNTTETIWQFDDMRENVIYSQFFQGRIQSRYLNGFPLPGATIRISGRAKKQSQPFPDFSAYSFDVMDQKGLDLFENIFQGPTDREGRASFSHVFSLESWNAPLFLSLEALTTLPGGGTSQEGKLVSLSPFNRYLGCKRNEGTGWSGNYLQDEKIEIQLVSVNPQGKKVGTPVNVSYTIEKHKESWWVDKYVLASQGHFTMSQYWKQVSQGNTTLRGTGTINIPARSLERGAYKVTFQDKDSGHKTQMYFTVYYGESNIPGSQPFILQFDTDREKCQVGEEINVQLPSISEAKALVSVEKGNVIIHQEWVGLGSEVTNLKLKTDANWFPNAYIHVTVMQPYKQTNNDLPLRMYGIRHVKVSDEGPILKPTVQFPSRIESGGRVSCSISETSGVPMEYTIALVDEGILGVTGFNTPDPGKHFFGRYALLVKTWDLYQKLIRYFKGHVAGIISVGGDQAYHPDAIPEMSRFRSLSLHLGPFRLKKGEKRVHSLSIPSFAGRARLMVIGCGEGRFGKFEQSVQVRQDVMLKAQFPAVLYAGDKCTIPATVFTELQGTQSATLKATASPGYVTGLMADKIISFDKTRQATAYFQINALNKTGNANFQLEARAGGKSAKETGVLPFRYPHSQVTTSSPAYINPGKELTLTAKQKGMKGSFQSFCLVNQTATPDLVRYVNDLTLYPYGCLEQITSRGIGLLASDKVSALSPEEIKVRKSGLSETLDHLSALQMSTGKFSYWENQQFHAWSDIFAAFFLQKMNERGNLAGYEDLLTRWLDIHQAEAENWIIQSASSTQVYEDESLIQAFRLYVLSKAGLASGSAINRFYSTNTSTHPLTWWLMAGVFHQAGFTAETGRLITKAQSLMPAYDAAKSWSTFGSQPRDLAIIVEILCHIPLHKNLSNKYYEAMNTSLQQRPWTSTQEKAWAILAVESFQGVTKNATVSQFSVEGSGSAARQYSLGKNGGQKINLLPGKTIKIRNNGKSKLYILQTESYLPDAPSTNASKQGLEMNTKYTNVTGKTSGLQGVHLGDEISLAVEISNPGPFDLESLALSVRAPGGMQLVNRRISGLLDDTPSEDGVYQDYEDDRVHSFFALPSGGKQRFTFVFQAAFEGDFFLPEVSCEHMYRGDVFARSGSSRIQIKSGE